MITITPLTQIPLIKEGDNLAKMIIQSAKAQKVELEEDDIVVVTQKIVSKSEGRIVNLEGIKPSSFARWVALKTDRDPRYVEAILRETNRFVKMKYRHIITETKHGFVCANAGIDRSNIEGKEIISLLPKDPDESARKIKAEIGKLTGKNVAVIITDTWGRPWRLGQVNFAIGVAGMTPFRDHRGEEDMFGYTLRVTNIAIADELASAAELVMAKSDRIPVVVIKGCKYLVREGSAKDLIRPLKDDLFK